jgi:heme exporter protein B
VGVCVGKKWITFGGMNTLGQMLVLLRKEFLLELRTKYAIGGILLYVVSTVFVVYTAFRNVSPPVWNVLFWVMFLFTATNAVAKSFVSEHSTRQLYYYTLGHPLAVLGSKIVYNFVLLFFITLLSFGLFSLMAGNPVEKPVLFVLLLLLASWGFSVAFTFISALAAKTANNATMTAILGFPVVIPKLLLCIKVSASAIGLLTDSSLYKDFLILGATDVILISIVWVLFGYLWRD